jgi:cysteinyl-tRNA synthetase
MWQKSLPDEPFWESPWGKGRPGWHIECSAMIYKILGPQIDIHGGGFDLIYPHHESEVAQSESFTGKVPFVSNFLHVGMLYYKGEKMSKSLGNLILVSDLLKTYSSQAVRWLLLSHHYRIEWEYFEKDIIKAQKEVDIVLELIEETTNSPIDKAFLLSFESFMEDDFNTPKALQLIFSKAKDPGMNATIRKALTILGFTLQKR